MAGQTAYSSIGTHTRLAKACLPDAQQLSLYVLAEPGKSKGRPAHSHFDGIWKDALTRWLPDCLRIFWPAIHAQIDWCITPRFLDKELQNLSKIRKHGTQHVDHLAEVCLLNGKNALLLIHIEIQAGTVGPELAWRMLRYAIRLLEKHPDHTHFSCAILLDRDTGSDTLTYTAPTKGSNLTFEFPVINLGAWANRLDELQILAPANPFAVVVLAQLACRATQPDKTRLVSKLELAKLLKQWGYTETLWANLLRIIDSMLILPEALENIFYNTLTQLEDENAMHYISSIERIYWDRKIAEIKDELLHKGEQQGLKKGQQLGERQGASTIVQRQLQRKFGTLPPHLEQRLKQSTPAELETWSLKVLDADSLDEVFAD